MKFTRILLLSGSLLAFVGIAKADGIDPAIGVRGGGGSLPFTGVTTAGCEVSPCSLTLPAPEVFFDNRTPDSIAAFDFLWDGPQLGGFSVMEGSLFTGLDIISPFDSTAPEVILFGERGSRIPSCGDAEICAPDTTFELLMGGMSGDVTITSSRTVPSLPEPASVLLMLGGLAGVAALRSRRNKVQA